MGTLEDHTDENIFNNLSYGQEDKKKTAGFTEKNQNRFFSDNDFKKSNTVSSPHKGTASSREGNPQSFSNMEVIPEIPIGQSCYANEISCLETINSSMASPKKKSWHPDSPKSPLDGFQIYESQYEESGKNIFMNTTFGGMNAKMKKLSMLSH